MIVTCASCLTKFNLDDSRIPAKGAKVRCSRCQHVFYIVPPPETKEEIIEDFESFARYHGELMGPGQEEEVEAPRPPEVKTEAIVQEKGAPSQKVEQVVSVKPLREEKAEVKTAKPKRIVPRERRSPTFFFALLVILVLLIFGVFYLFSEFGHSGKLSPYLGYPVKKITHLWNQIWGTENEGLVVGSLNGYEEKIGEVPLLIIEGKVSNHSGVTRRHVKIRVAVFDQEKVKVAEKEAVCGRILSRGELKNLQASFFKGEMVNEPKEEEMITPPGKAIPFMVIFKDLSNQAKEFKVEIVEAPSL